jgi:hypothetical protein
MNWWGRGLVVLLLLSFIVVACEEEENLLGFRSPDQNFKVVYQEFTLPTSVYQVDSLVTSNGSNQTGSRLLVGSFDDSRFGRGSATAYLQYFPTTFPAIAETATFQRLTLAVVFDYYLFGDEGASSQTYELRELSDSLVNSSAYFSKSSTGILAKPVATTTRLIDPDVFKGSLELNSDLTPANDLADSLVFELDGLGPQLFGAVRTTDSASMAVYRNFSRWRRIFKGFAIVPVGNNKVIGLNITHAKTNMTLHYMEGTTAKKITFTVSPNAGLMTYSSLTIDRSGTPIGGITGFYEDIEPADGNRYIQSGAGIVTKVDMKAVYDYFANIPLKSLNVAELSIITDEQKTAPLSFLMRAVKPDNRNIVALKKGINEVYDSILYPDPAFVAKHFIDPSSSPRADVAGDEGELFTLAQRSNTAGKAIYKGYMTTFLQRELELADKDYLVQFSLVPIAPSFTKSLNGFHFHKDSVRLKIFYTTTTQSE